MRKMCVLMLILLVSLSVWYQFSISEEKKVEVQYYAVDMDEESEIYDGDTIQDVYIDIFDFKVKYPAKLLWPGVFVKGDDLYVFTDIRIAGIDTPEKKPKRAGRTPESIALEKAAAAEAQKALADLLNQYDLEFVVANPELGKYAGRIVADVLVGPDKISVADYMLKNGHAYPYDGDEKIPFDEWYQSESTTPD